MAAAQASSAMVTLAPGGPELSTTPDTIAASSSPSSSAFACTRSQVGLVYKLSGANQKSTHTRASVKRIRHLALVSAHTNLHLVPTSSSTSDPVSASDLPSTSSSSYTADFHLSPLQSFLALNPTSTIGGEEALGQAAPVSLCKGASRTTYVVLSQPQPALRVFYEKTTGTSSSTSSRSRTIPVQLQTTLPAEFGSDPISHLNFLNSGELITAHANSPSISIFEHNPVSTAAAADKPDGSADATAATHLIKTWSFPIPLDHAQANSRITHHFTHFDSTPALHLLRYTATSFVQHERVSAIAVRIASSSLPQTSIETAAAPTKPASKTRQGRKSAIQVMDDLNALPGSTSSMTATHNPDPSSPLRLQVVLIQSRGKDAAAADRVQLLGDVVIPGFEGARKVAPTANGTAQKSEGKAEARFGQVHLYRLHLGTEAVPTLILQRTIQLHHFHFAPTSSSSAASQVLSQPASVLALSPTHLFLAGLVLVPTSASTTSASQTGKKYKTRLYAVILDTALEVIVAESDLSSMLPSHFSVQPSNSSASTEGAESSGVTDSTGSSASRSVEISAEGVHISALRGAGSEILLQLSASSRSSSRRNSNPAASSRGISYTVTMALPYTVPAQSSVRHAMGKAGLTSRWIAGVYSAQEGSGSGLAVPKKQRKQDRRRPNAAATGTNTSADAAAAANANGVATSSKRSESVVAPFERLVQSREGPATAEDWTLVSNTLQSRPDLVEDDLVRLLVCALSRSQRRNGDEHATLRAYLRSFLPIPLSRPLVRAALKRHLRLAGAAKAGSAGAGDDVLGRLQVLTEVLCGWVDSSAQRTLERSGTWGKPNGTASAELPKLDDILLLLTDLLDTFFPYLLGAAASAPSSAATSAIEVLQRIQSALRPHISSVSSLSLLLGPLNAFAALEADRVRVSSAVHAAAAAAEEGADQVDVHPALRSGALEPKRKGVFLAGVALPASGKLSKKQQRKLQERLGKSQKNGATQARAVTGGGGPDGAGLAADGAGRAKRRMMMEASMLVGEYAVEVLEF
ncbi:hypothetical protein OC861_001447 [Tilletia horrida]|nr:hypothetical protein OC861_001447 [Tilletia horrida]